MITSNRQSFTNKVGCELARIDYGDPEMMSKDLDAVLSLKVLYKLKVQIEQAH